MNPPRPRIYKSCGCWNVRYYDSPTQVTFEFEFWTWAVRSVTGWLPHPMWVQQAGGHKQ